MPSSRESKIEDFAFDYLQNNYSLQQGAKNVLISKSDKTKNGAEVDGLFTFKDKESAVFVATLSFRNSPKLAKLLTNYKKHGLSKVRYITPVILLVASFLLTHQNDQLYYPWAFPISVAIAGYSLHSFIEKSFLKHKIRLWLNDLQQHHANEKWLGISISSLYFRNNKLADYCLKYCDRNGFGLITIGKRSKVVLMQEPKTFVCRRGDYLSHFKTEESIRKALESKNILRVA